MKFRLICMGKTEEKYLRSGEEIYIKRLRHYVPVDKVEIPELKSTKNLSEDEIRIQEGKLILKQITSGEIVILLDENGKSFRSVEFSKHIEKLMNRGGKSISFIIGGPYGFSDELYDRANDKVSLSPMTFSHQMIRLFFLEQLYRSFTILRGEPYHHE